MSGVTAGMTGMWGFDTLAIPVQVTDNMVTAPLWLGAVLAGVVVILLLLALVRAGAASTLAFVALVGFGAWFAWSWLDHERISERRTIEARLIGLDSQAAAPSSPLACLDANGSEALDQACERALFASAEASASALAFTATRLAVLGDGLETVKRRGQPPMAALQRLQTALEQDRYGVVAQTLANRGCTAERCEALALLRDAGKVQANLRTRTFDGHVARYAPNWASRAGRAASSGSTPGPVAAGTPLPPNYTLPSADSIPAASIMDPEPATQRRAEAVEPRGKPSPSRPAAPARRPNGGLNTPPSPSPNFTPTPSSGQNAASGLY
jgi:hypothetical protein